MTENYKQMLQKGLEYQDFVTNILLSELGIALSSYSSIKYQCSVGENKQGIEIKFDDRYENTGNLYIETQEKSNPNNMKYIDSGIYRSDNTWLYLIGNYKEIFIFSKKQLVIIHKRKTCREVKTTTSIGFLIPKDEAEKYSIKKIIL